MAENGTPEFNFPWPKQGDQLIAETGSRHYDAWISGHSDLFAHVEGYKRAADLVWAQIEENPRLAGIDYLVYPMVFLYRHYVELSIKDIISLGNYLEHEPATFPAKHGLKELWKVARDLIERIGPGCTTETLDAMTELISQLDAIDPESFAFRYPMTKKWTPSLSGLGNLNLELLHEGMEKMASFFEGAHSMFTEYKSHLDSIHP